MVQLTETKRIPVIEGWFTVDLEEPHLIGNRCKLCGDYFFPKALICRNPHCRGSELEEVALSREGKLWSFTNNYYQPPAPYVSQDPFEPYAIVVVELPKEKLMIMGQLAKGYDYAKLKIGMNMELIVELLYEDNNRNSHIVWKWKPQVDSYS